MINKEALFNICKFKSITFLWSQSTSYLCEEDTSIDALVSEVSHLVPETGEFATSSAPVDWGNVLLVE